MSSIRLDLAYHGARFAGWATQPGRRTVQGELHEALATLLGSPVTLKVAGRTDAGVHAWAQVASFENPGTELPATLLRSLNAMTGDDLVVLAVAEAAPGFDARLAARSRTYCYRLLAAPAPSPFERGVSLWWPHRVERDALDACARLVTGTHDFTAFTPTQTEHRRFERTVARCEWIPGAGHRPGGALDERGVLLELWIEANSFLRSMVRILTGTMLSVASGRRTLENFERLLAGAPREQAGDTARAQGLHLAGVSYGRS